MGQHRVHCVCRHRGTGCTGAGGHHSTEGKGEMLTAKAGPLAQLKQFAVHGLHARAGALLLAGR